MFNFCQSNNFTKLFHLEILITIICSWVRKVSLLSFELYLPIYRSCFHQKDDPSNMIMTDVSCLYIFLVSPWLVMLVFASRSPAYSSTTSSNIISYVRNISLPQSEKPLFFFFLFKLDKLLSRKDTFSNFHLWLCV